MIELRNITRSEIMVSLVGGFILAVATTIFFLLFGTHLQIISSLRTILNLQFGTPLLTQILPGSKNSPSSQDSFSAVHLFDLLITNISLNFGLSTPIVTSLRTLLSYWLSVDFLWEKVPSLGMGVFWRMLSRDYLCSDGSHTWLLYCY